MHEISSHKMSSILSIYKLKFGSFLGKTSKSVLNDTVTQRAGILGFSSTVGYNVALHYRHLGSLYVLEISKKAVTENMG